MRSPGRCGSYWTHQVCVLLYLFATHFAANVSAYAHEHTCFYHGMLLLPTKTTLERTGQTDRPWNSDSNTYRKLVMLACCAAFSTSASLADGTPYRMLSAILPSKRTGSWSTTPTCHVIRSTNVNSVTTTTYNSLHYTSDVQEMGV